jgi:hypothetical protein
MGEGGREEETREKVRGAIVHKVGSKIPVKTTFSFGIFTVN